MEETKSKVGIKIHQAFKEMAHTQQQILQVEALRQMGQGRLEKGRMTNQQFEESESRFKEQRRQLFFRLENKSREVEQLKILIHKGNG